MTAPDTWVRRYHPAPSAATRLVCLPHAGGSASFYFPVSRALSPDVEVLAIQYPGRQDRRAEQPLTDLRELAAQITTAVLPFADRPVALFGHSMGALLAYEIGLRLQTAAVPVPVVFISGRRAPSRPRPEDVHRRTDDGIVAEMRELNGTEGGVLGDEEMLRVVLPAVRADYQAVETYRYQPGASLSCSISAFAGEQDPRVDVVDVAAWAEHTTGRFDLRTFPGGHFFLTANQAAVLADIRGRLTSVRSS
jgi:surfactin synthase thioesterase subunit